MGLLSGAGGEGFQCLVQRMNCWLGIRKLLACARLSQDSPALRAGINGSASPRVSERRFLEVVKVEAWGIWTVLRASDWKRQVRGRWLSSGSAFSFAGTGACADVVGVGVSEVKKVE